MNYDYEDKVIEKYKKDDFKNKIKIRDFDIEDIGIDNLIKRIEKEKFEEIIFALKPSIEGETTSLYIKKILEGMNVKITRLASGVPIGADMEYIDSLTLERALSDRKEV